MPDSSVVIFKTRDNYKISLCNSKYAHFTFFLKNVHFNRDFCINSGDKGT